MIIRSTLLAFSLTSNPLASSAQSAPETPRDPTVILCDMAETAKNVNMDLSGLYAQFEGEAYVIHETPSTTSNPNFFRLNYPEKGYPSDIFAKVIRDRGDKTIEIMRLNGIRSRDLQPTIDIYDFLHTLSLELDNALINQQMPEPNNTIRPICGNLIVS